jgi:hypothetical protein
MVFGEEAMNSRELSSIYLTSRFLMGQPMPRPPLVANSGAIVYIVYI